MKSGLMNTIVSAIVGGVVGAVVVVACGGMSKQELPESFDKLKVGELIVSERMMLWEDGKDDADLRIENGGMLARTRVIATQLCGNAVMANHVLTTPDHPASPLDQCEIFTEMGSSRTEGGMFTVRSPDGGNRLSNPNGIRSGWAYTISYSFDEQNQLFSPVCFFRRNDTGLRALGRFEIPQITNPENAANPNVPQAGAPDQLEVSQNLPSATMNPPMQNMPAPGQNPGVEHSAMTPPVTVPR